MRPSPRRRRLYRLTQFEPVESRLLLSGDPIAGFHLDYFVESQLHDEIHTTLANAHDLTGLDVARSEYGFDGRGQTVAVIDSGIAYDHYALGGGLGSGYRVVGGFDFTAERDADPYDDGPYGSHGTHLAGIIGSSASFSPGVAPGVDLVGLRVFDDAGNGRFEWVEEALRWVHTNRNAFENPITAVNVSLGSNWNSDSVPGWATLEDELARLKTDGIFISVAAGNGFTTYESPGLSYPAVSPHVVPVASVDNNGALSYFSQRDQRVIAAPGRSVLSTVPDYLGNHNGIDDDFARYSGTSMAAPYVAGASVLLRQAYEFVGVTNVSPGTIYNLMINTADTVYDPATGQSYSRLNLDRAIDAVMPADDFGSSQATAYNLGTITDAASRSGTIGSLTDRDWFRFTAAMSGSVTIEASVTGDLLPEWQLAGNAPGATGADGGVLSFDVVAGQSYSFGLATDDGLGHYTLDVHLEPNMIDVDWGTILQERFDGNRIDAAGRWFAFTAAAEGLLTVEALFAGAQGNVDLELFDANYKSVGSSSGIRNYERIDVFARAGDTFYLRAYTGAGVNDQVDFRVTNLVSRSGTTVHVLGTGGNDAFTFSTAATHRFTINGVAYQFATTKVNSITFDGLAGSDTVVLTGTNGNDTVVLRPGSAQLSGPGYHVRTINVEDVTVHAGGGSDRAVFYDSAGNDSFYASVGAAGMSGDGFDNRAKGFETVQAFATAGGSDNARLYDSAGNDTLVARPRFARMFGSGFDRRVHGFAAVHAFATAGGTDVARLYDSAGNDTFFGNPIVGALYGRGFYNRAKFFEQVHALATAGGNDVARLFDSAGNDTFAANSISGRLWGNGFSNRATFFDEVHASATAGGNDVAKLFDSAGNDTFLAGPTGGTLFGAGFLNEAKSFDGLHAYATAGGNDVARLFDSAGSDTLVVTADSSALFGKGFYNRAKFFEEVHANGEAGGHDKGLLSDSQVDDYFQASGTSSRIFNDRAITWLYGFEYVRATSAQGGSDSAEVVAVDYVLQLDGNWS